MIPRHNRKSVCYTYLPIIIMNCNKIDYKCDIGGGGQSLDLIQYAQSNEPATQCGIAHKFLLTVFKNSGG